MFYDVAIIGAGVVGSLIARQLSQYDLKICLLEKDFDVAMGSSKANSGIVHAGYDAKPGSLKARLNVQGNEMMARVTAELDVPFRRTGSLVVAFAGESISKLQELYENGVSNGVKGLQIISGEAARKLEPGLSPQASGALLAPSGGIVCPYELALGAAENAVTNGVDLWLGAEVNQIAATADGFTISSGKGVVQSRYLINAAGLYADSIAALLGEADFTIKPRKGEYLLFDHNQENTVRQVLFQMPSEMGKGILVAPTVDGNLLIGPNAHDIEDKTDKATTLAGLAEVTQLALKSVPGLNFKDVITSFAGLRATPATGDFIIRAASKNPRLIHVAGIESPGLTAAPAIAQYVQELVSDCGLVLRPKAEFSLTRRRLKRLCDLEEAEINRLIKQEPRYGNIICRCEGVSEAEIVAAIRRPAGATNLDAIKRRTRAGMGRCQGGFCSPRVVEILARELQIPLEEVTKCGGNSRILVRKTK